MRLGTLLRLGMAGAMLAGSGGCLQKLAPPPQTPVTYKPFVTWQTALGAPVALPMHASGGRILAAAGKDICLLDAATGEILHRESTPFEWKSLRAAGGRVLLACPEAVWLWDMDERRALRRREPPAAEPFAAGLYAGPRGARFWVYVEGREVRMAPDSESGEEAVLPLAAMLKDAGHAGREEPGNARKFSEPDSLGPAMTLHQGVLYAASRHGVLYAFDLRQRRLLWSRVFPEGISVPPLSDENTLFVGAGDKKLYALRAGSGGRRWALRTGGFLLAQPVLHEGRLYTASNDLFLYALYAHGGHRVWNVNVTKRSDSLLLVPPHGIAVKPRFHPSFEIYGFELGHKVLDFSLADSGDHFIAPLLWAGETICAATYRGDVYALKVVEDTGEAREIPAAGEEKEKAEPEPPAGAPMAPEKKKNEPKPR
jgi:hypothetical protein